MRKMLTFDPLPIRLRIVFLRLDVDVFLFYGQFVQGNR